MTGLRDRLRFVDGHAFAEVAHFQAGKIIWRRAIGLQSSGLTMQVGEDEKSIELKGDMGGVATDLSLKLLHDSDGGISGLETSGLFNGEEYKMQSKIDMGGLGLLGGKDGMMYVCLLYTSPSPRDRTRSRMPSSA